MYIRLKRKIKKTRNDEAQKINHRAKLLPSL